LQNFKLFFENLSNDSNLKSQILGSAFFREIRYMGGKLYFVGGATRDHYLGLPSKDIDVIISNISPEQLTGILGKHGSVNSVGESFGVIKFVPKEFEVSEPIDIALPRKERPMKPEEREVYKQKYGKYPSAYQAFTVEPDHFLKIEDDLLRRDFTINAIAHDHLGNSIDPYGGVKDIKNKVIRMVSAKNFSEDPLRMLRGVQFASRFGFKIESKTFDSIRRNASLISGIPGERILVEMEKIVKKGDQLLGAKLLCETSLWQEISRLSCKDHNEDAALFKQSERSKTLAEFLFLMMFKVASFEEASSVSKRLKCDTITEKHIKGLYYAWDKQNEENPHVIVFNLNRIHPTCLQLLVLPEVVKSSISSDMPKSVKDLSVDGGDLMGMGYKGEEISNAFNDILSRIFSGAMSNSREEIINHLHNS